jgi:hypothetical protein
MNDKTVGGVPWSFWAIGAVALIWNVMGIMNFLWQMNADTLAAMPELHRSIAEGRPAWATGAFALAVLGALSVAFCFYSGSRLRSICLSHHSLA